MQIKNIRTLLLHIIIFFGMWFSLKFILSYIFYICLIMFRHFVVAIGNGNVQLIILFIQYKICDYILDLDLYDLKSEWKKIVVEIE